LRRWKKESSSWEWLAVGGALQPDLSLFWDEGLNRALFVGAEFFDTDLIALMARTGRF
jgi:hypothetical protein